MLKLKLKLNTKVDSFIVEIIPSFSLDRSIVALKVMCGA